MSNYTDEQVLKAVKYACGIQKATDYQEVGGILLGDDYEPTMQDLLALDYLSNEDNISDKITLEELEDEFY